MARSLAGAVLLAATTVAAVSPLASCPGKAPEPRPSPVALIVTPSEEADPRAFAGAEALVAADAERAALAARSRKASPPAAIARHAALPDAPTPKARAEALVALLLDAASDPLIRSIVVAPAPEGCADAFRALRGRRKDIALVAIEPADARLAIEAASDLVVELDRLYRPYFAAASAKAAGAKRFVEAAVRGSASGARSREEAVLRAACTELGLAFRLAAVEPDQRDHAWLGELGPDCALYCADDFLAESVAEAALAAGATVVDGGPESLEAWRRVLASGLPADFEKADAEGRLKRIERAAVELAGRGRIAVWTGGYALESVEGLGEFARGLALGSTRADDLKSIVAALKSRSPGSAWIAAFDADPGTGVKAANHVLLRQDPFALGVGYAQSALKSAPPSYLTIGPAAP